MFVQGQEYTLDKKNIFIWHNTTCLRLFVHTLAYITRAYSIVKDSNADLGVIFRFLQNSPITKAVCTKISIFFLHLWQNFDVSERK